MPGYEDGPVVFDDEALRMLNHHLLELAEKMTGHIKRYDDRHAHLIVLAALEYASKQAKLMQGPVAKLAAQGGADYADMARALGITKQAAGYRWPGLAEVTRAARNGHVPPGKPM